MEAVKTTNTDERFTHPVRTRVTQAVYERLEKLIEKGDCHSIGEVSRKILSNEQIKVFHMDTSLNTAMEELALIRKELKAIGVNINQITKAYHSSASIILISAFRFTLLINLSKSCLSCLGS